MEQRSLFAALTVASIIVLWPLVDLILGLVIGPFFGAALSTNTNAINLLDLLLPAAFVALAGVGLVMTLLGIFHKASMSFETAKNLLEVSGLVLFGSLLSLGLAIGLRNTVMFDPCTSYYSAANRLWCVDMIQGMGYMVSAVLLSAVIPGVTIVWVLLRRTLLRFFGSL